MSRLRISAPGKTHRTLEQLNRDFSRRIAAGSPDLCPAETAAAFIGLCHSQSCGKCVPCRIGLQKLVTLIKNALDGDAAEGTIELIKKTAEAIALSADCAIGYEAAARFLDAFDAVSTDLNEHIGSGTCAAKSAPAVPCVAGCPAGVDIPGYIALTLEGKYADAVRLIRKDNPFPAVCALICEHPCEERCRRGIIDYPVNIRGLKRYAVENAGDVPVPGCMPPTEKKVAVIGGGPGGLTAAYFLRLMGHGVTIFERRKQLGGMLRYGIPSYRLPRELLDGEIKTILSAGIEVRTGISAGDDISMEDIASQFDAVYIAAGAQLDKSVGLEEARGVISAIELFRQIGDGDMPSFTGKKVAVIGGGNVAMDAARTSVRLGAEGVSIVYRRRKDDMTALREEIEGAVAEGCEILELFAPAKIEKDADGTLTALYVSPQMIGEFERGRPKSGGTGAADVRLECDIVIVAIGQGIDSRKFEEYGLPTKWGALAALDWSGFTEKPGIFAGGDCVSGPSTVIRAIEAGKVAAANIDRYLGFNHEIKTDVQIPDAKPNMSRACGRVNMREREAAGRKDDFNPVEDGMLACESAQEAGRCLRCDYYGLGTLKGGRNIIW